MNRRALFAACLAFLACAKTKQRPVIPATPFVIPAGWHRTTREEKAAEYERELREMNAAGWYGDPPISMGFMAGFGVSGYGAFPGHYTDGKGHFRTQYFLHVDRKKYELTKSQYDSLYTNHGSGNVSEFDVAAHDGLVNLAKAGKLPLSPKD